MDDATPPHGTGAAAHAAVVITAPDAPHPVSPPKPLQVPTPTAPPPSPPGDPPKRTSRIMAVAAQQQKTRLRKGSLRKAALLGRGAQREQKELAALPLFAQGAAPRSSAPAWRGSVGASATDAEEPAAAAPAAQVIPLESSSSSSSSSAAATAAAPTAPPADAETRISPPLSYMSTTDDDDYFAATSDRRALYRRRSSKKPNSPLALGNLPAANLPAADGAWDYAETEWWGWVVLLVTWAVFVMGMGSCLDVWSWAWDVGETPYAPPELEDDPTLPIVGYYPALIILTSVMAIVWVSLAWVGMKYFRHAKISGD